MSARNVTRSTVLATELEVADSLWAKFKGLMGRPSLAPGAGLWLPASNGIHMMFMRFPIDAVFVGRERAEPGGSGGSGGAGGSGGSGRSGGSAGSDRAGGALRPVVSVHRELRAWTGLVPLIRGADGVLELPVGTIDRSGTTVGDLVRIEV